MEMGEGEMKSELVKEIIPLISSNGYDDFDTIQVKSDAEEIAELFLAKLKDLEQKLEVAKSALGFYADKNNWDSCAFTPNDVEAVMIPHTRGGKFYGGKRAREALAKMENET